MSKHLATNWLEPYWAEFAEKWPDYRVAGAEIWYIPNANRLAIELNIQLVCH